MQVREAKDFLVQQTAEQAQVEGVALSELEKRMMYFTQEQRLAATFEAQGKQSRPLHRQNPGTTKRSPGAHSQSPLTQFLEIKGCAYRLGFWGDHFDYGFFGRDILRVKFQPYVCSIESGGSPLRSRGTN
jgi:hypothetical protein